MKKFRNIAIIVLVLIIAVIITLSIIFSVNISPVDKNDKTQIEVVIPSGTTKKGVGKILEEKGLIRSSKFFEIYVKLFKVGDIKATKYSLSKNMDLKEIISILEKGNSYNPEQVKITFKEGINIRMLASIIEENTSNSADDVINLLNSEKYLDELIEKYWFITEDVKNNKLYYSLEGYLFPDTYYFANKDVTVREIFAKMLDKMQSVLDEYKEKIKKSDYSVHEILTLASIIEKEGKNEDFKDISSVFYNRLNKKMSLGSCATAYYGMKMDFDEIGVATSAMMNDKNDYNTYVLDKLPVGAISLPGKGAIDAAINPNDTENLYFISDNKGKTYFFKTYKEQQAKKQQLQRENKWNR